MPRHKFRDLVAETMTADEQAAARALADRLRAEMPLQELRHARELTQATMAELLDSTQSEVSRLERRADMYVSTLRRYVEAMGGRLEIAAHFPEGVVRITQFHAPAESREREPGEPELAPVAVPGSAHS